MDGKSVGFYNQNKVSENAQTRPPSELSLLYGSRSGALGNKSEWK